MVQVAIKATGDGIGYASKSPYEWEGKTFEPDIQNGDKVTILNGGDIEAGGQFEPALYCKIKTRNGEKKAKFNQSSINIIAGVYGVDTEKWTGKEVTVLTKKGVFGGTKGIAAYFVTEGWYLDEYGDLVQDVPTTRDPIFTPKTENQQSVEDIRNQSVEQPPF